MVVSSTMERDASSASGEQDFEQLFRVHYPQLVIFFGRRGFDPELSRDLAQDSLLRAFKGLPDFEGRAQLRTWILQIATHLAQNYHRDHRHTVKRGVRETSLEAVRSAGRQFGEAEALWGREQTKDPERRAVERQALDRMHGAVRDLAPRQRECLLLWLEGCKYREISERLGISLQAVRSIIHQAKERLRLQLAEEAPEEATAVRELASKER